jgi:hypothetical protein
MLGEQRVQTCTKYTTDQNRRPGHEVFRFLDTGQVWAANSYRRVSSPVSLSDGVVRSINRTPVRASSRDIVRLTPEFDSPKISPASVLFDRLSEAVGYEVHMGKVELNPSWAENCSDSLIY